MALSPGEQHTTRATWQPQCARVIMYVRVFVCEVSEDAVSMYEPVEDRLLTTFCV